jgi:hypothetical protein
VIALDSIYIKGIIKIQAEKRFMKRRVKLGGLPFQIFNHILFKEFILYLLV